MLKLHLGEVRNNCGRTALKPRTLQTQPSRIKGPNSFKDISLTHSHTMTPFDAPGKQAF